MIIIKFSRQNTVVGITIPAIFYKDTKGHIGEKRASSTNGPSQVGWLHEEQ